MTGRHQLGRFLDAQSQQYAIAVAEMQAGEKRSHWMWYIFPQIAGLGSSAMSRHYAIRSSDEARAYWLHPILGSRLRQCVLLLLAADQLTAEQIFGPIDALKLRSSLTLFMHSVDLPPDQNMFAQLLQRWYDGPDPKTINILTQLCAI